MNGTIDDTSMHTALLDVPLHSGFWGGGERQNPQALCSEGITCKMLKVSEPVGFRCRAFLFQPLMKTESAFSLIPGEIL